MFRVIQSAARTGLGTRGKTCGTRRHCPLRTSARSVQRQRSCAEVWTSSRPRLAWCLCSVNPWQGRKEPEAARELSSQLELRWSRRRGRTEMCGGCESRYLLEFGVSTGHPRHVVMVVSPIDRYRNILPPLRMRRSAGAQIFEGMVQRGDSIDLIWVVTRFARWRDHDLILNSPSAAGREGGGWRK